MDKLVNMYFHKFGKDRKIEYQGQIIIYLGGENYLVEYISFLDGLSRTRVLSELKDMRTWSFYDSADEMNDIYEKKSLQK